MSTEKEVKIRLHHVIAKSHIPIITASALLNSLN